MGSVSAENRIQLSPEISAAFPLWANVTARARSPLGRSYSGADAELLDVVGRGCRRAIPASLGVPEYLGLNISVDRIAGEFVVQYKKIPPSGLY